MVGDKRKETMGRETYAPGSYCNPGEATNIAAPSSRDTGTGNSAVFSPNPPMDGLGDSP